jgi:hypothetical protein
MFEPIGKYEGNNSPMDAKEDGREEWVAAEAIEIRSDYRKMLHALTWDGEQTGSEDVYEAVSVWMTIHQYFDAGGRASASDKLRVVLQELAERYADQVLWPQYLAKVKNGNFEG